MKLKNISKLE